MGKISLMRNVFTAVFLFLIILAGSVLASPPDNFTAKIVTMGRSMPMAKMGNKSRVENPMMGGLVTITFRDTKKSITMSTKNKTYFEQATQEKVPSLHDPNVVIEKKKVGSEAIDGHPCIKSEAVYYFKDKPQEKFLATIWEAQDLGGLLIRNEMIVPESKVKGIPGNVVTEFKEIKVGAATASLFEVPNDYKKVNSIEEALGMGDMQEMMKQMQKMKPSKGPKD